MTQDKAQALLIRGGQPLRGDVRLGPDTAVQETTLALAALACGRSELQGVRASSQLSAALAAWGQLGVRAELDAEQLRVESPGLDAFTPPRGFIECGRSPRLLAQLAGVLAGQRFGTQLRAAGCGDVPVGHWVEVLRARGAQIGARTASGAAAREEAGVATPASRSAATGEGHASAGAESGASMGEPAVERLFPPVMVAPLLAAEVLSPLDASLPYSDAVAKDAILLNALFAAGPTVLSEPLVSSDHLERALLQVGLPLRRIGSVVSLDVPAWNRELPGLCTLRIPGSATLAATLAALVQALAGSDVSMREVSVNPSQSGVLDLLRSWGAAIAVTPTGDAALREPIADVRVRPAAVRGGVVDAELLLRAGDAVPMLLVLGALSARGVRLCELSAFAALQRDRGWESLDPLFALFGIEIERGRDELFVPPRQLGPGAPAAVQRVWDARDDPQTALTACTLALATPGETVVEHAAEALFALYPGFIAALEALGASIKRV